MLPQTLYKVKVGHHDHASILHGTNSLEASKEIAGLGGRDPATLRNDRSGDEPLLTTALG